MTGSFKLNSATALQAGSKIVENGRIVNLAKVTPKVLPRPFRAGGTRRL
jgi:hypothetical protein